MGPSIDPSVRVQDRPFTDVERWNFVEDLLKASSFLTAPTVFLRKRENFSSADYGRKDHCLPITEIEFCPGLDSPWRFPSETEQQVVSSRNRVTSRALNQAGLGVHQWVHRRATSRRDR